MTFEYVLISILGVGIAVLAGFYYVDYQRLLISLQLRERYKTESDYYFRESIEYAEEIRLLREANEKYDQEIKELEQKWRLDYIDKHQLRDELKKSEALRCNSVLEITRLREDLRRSQEVFGEWYQKNQLLHEQVSKWKSQYQQIHHWWLRDVDAYEVLKNEKLILEEKLNEFIRAKRKRSAGRKSRK